MSVLGWVRSKAVIVLLASMQAGAQPPKVIAFTNVSVVPMTGNQVVSNRTVVVTGDRITAMGPVKTTAVPQVATRVDGQGKFLMPGLAEMHGHIPPPTAPRELVDNVLLPYILVDANPLQNVSKMEKQSGLMLRGRWLPASEIEPVLAKIAASK